MISLNAKNITDEMMAIAAVRSAVATEVQPRIITRDQLPALRQIMRQVFSSLIIDLNDYVESAEIDADIVGHAQPYDASESLKLQATFTGEAQLAPKKAMLLKRSLEHVVAVGTLQWVLTEGLSNDDVFARHLSDERQRETDTVKALLNTLKPKYATPIIRPLAW